MGCTDFFLLNNNLYLGLIFRPDHRNMSAMNAVLTAIKTEVGRDELDLLELLRYGGEHPTLLVDPSL